LFAAGNKCFAVVDQENNVLNFLNLRFTLTYNTLRDNFKKIYIQV